MSEYYHVPEESWLRLHFVRPRFKGDIENVLLYMAAACCRIPDSPCDEYNAMYSDAIRLYPGNIGKSQKTIENWRTEIPALFGFYNEDKKNNITRTTKMAESLNENQDLPQFFASFLKTFQFPGGHLKAKDNIELINHGVKFKPAQFILQVLRAGNVLLSESKKEKDMSITKDEATYLIFNDVRVTSGKVPPEKVAELILENRKKKLKYYDSTYKNIVSNTEQPRRKGDVTRYAGDILDYMVIALLLDETYGYYYMKPNQKDRLDAIINDTKYFSGYDAFYGSKDLTTAEVASVEPMWYDYVNANMSSKDDVSMSKRSIDISDVIKPSVGFGSLIDNRLKQIISDHDSTKKDVGNIGETIVHSHEITRLTDAGYKELAALVQIVDSPSYHPGYDIDSFEGDLDKLHRYIEVKTTISKRPIKLSDFHMSTNEWSAASTLGEHYCVYRLFIHEGELGQYVKTLYVLRNPVQLYKHDKINGTMRNGVEVSFDRTAFKTTEVLVWQG